MKNEYETVLQREERLSKLANKLYEMLREEGITYFEFTRVSALLAETVASNARL